MTLLQIPKAQKKQIEQLSKLQSGQFFTEILDAHIKHEPAQTRQMIGIIDFISKYYEGIKEYE